MVDPLSPIPEQQQQGDADSTHDWFQYRAEWESCRVCGIVRRADRKNKPCKGPVRVTLRDEYTEGQSPPTEAAPMGEWRTCPECGGRGLSISDDDGLHECMTCRGEAMIRTPTPTEHARGEYERNVLSPTEAAPMREKCECGGTGYIQPDPFSFGAEPCPVCKSDPSPQADAGEVDESQKEDSLCTCGTAGSGEQHEPWCAYKTPKEHWIERELESFKAKMQWHSETPNDARSLVLANLNGFVGHLIATNPSPQADAPTEEHCTCPQTWERGVLVNGWSSDCPVHASPQADAGEIVRQAKEVIEDWSLWIEGPPAGASLMAKLIEQCECQAAELREKDAEIVRVAKVKQEYIDYWGDRCCKAEATISRLREALKPFAEAANHVPYAGSPVRKDFRVVKLADCEKAAALSIAKTAQSAPPGTT